jgi:hypothetical protein
MLTSARLPEAGSVASLRPELEALWIFEQSSRDELHHGLCGISESDRRSSSTAPMRKSAATFHSPIQPLRGDRHVRLQECQQDEET